jgi:hypothetical protein
MPDLIAIVTALILERPLCLRCLVDKSGASRPQVALALRRIGGVLTLHRTPRRRCHACGTVGRVVFVDRPQS